MLHAYILRYSWRQMVANNFETEIFAEKSIIMKHNFHRILVLTQQYRVTLIISYKIWNYPLATLSWDAQYFFQITILGDEVWPYAIQITIIISFKFWKNYVDTMNHSLVIFFYLACLCSVSHFLTLVFTALDILSNNNVPPNDHSDHVLFKDEESMIT